MPDNYRRFLKVLLTCALGWSVFWLASNREFFISSIVSAYFAPALVGAAIIYACIRPLRELWQVAVAAGLLWGVEFFVGRNRAIGIPLGIATVSLIGIGAFLILGLRAIWSTGDDQRMSLYAFLPAGIFAASDWFASDLLAMTEKLHPQVYDYFLYSFDASLKWQPVPLLGKLFLAHAWFKAVCMFVYVTLAIPIALVYGLNLREKGRSALPVMYAFLITGPVGVIFYNLLPAMGPAHAFQQAFPMMLPDYAKAAHLVPTAATLAGPRNAIPSLHMTWVLLAWWGSEDLSVAWRMVALFYVVFTVFATMGTGEHYLIDLIVAYPFALFLLSLCQQSLPFRSARRHIPIVLGLLTVLTWFSLLTFGYRIFWISPAIPWLAAIATVGGSILLHRWMNLPEADISGGIRFFSLRRIKRDRAVALSDQAPQNSR